MKNSFKILLGLFLVIFAISCSEDDGAAIAVLDKQDVVFDITNVVPQVAGKNSFVSGKENGENDPSIPDCSDLVPTHVNLVLDSGTAELAYTLNLVSLNNKTETEVLKLAPGNYTLTEFVVYSGTTPIWASPAAGSYYDLLWPSFNFTNVPFTVSAFDKVKVNVDVLCYEPYKYEEFGFAWFAYSKIEVHTVCFFGDICTKYFEEFHNEGSPYNGQNYDGYDFPAIFSIVVKDGQGNIVNDQQFNSNAEWYGAGSPLCIEYPDQVGIEESFTFEIMLAMPNGEYELVYTGSFDDTASSDTGNVEGFGGSDGVFDFVVGNCSYDSNDANMELPAYLPIPTSGIMTLSDGPFNNSTNTYVNLTFSSIVDPTTDIFDGAVLGAWCAANHDEISLAAYPVIFYSSLELVTIPSHYQDIEWGSLNWMMNNLTGTPEDIQEAIWQVINSTDTDTTNPEAGNAATAPFAVEALTHTGFIPSVGDWAIVICDPVEANAITRLQLLIVRIDP